MEAVRVDSGAGRLSGSVFGMRSIVGGLAVGCHLSLLRGKKIERKHLQPNGLLFATLPCGFGTRLPGFYAPLPCGFLFRSPPVSVDDFRRWQCPAGTQVFRPNGQALGRDCLVPRTSSPQPSPSSASSYPGSPLPRGSEMGRPKRMRAGVGSHRAPGTSALASCDGELPLRVWCDCRC